MAKREQWPTPTAGDASSSGGRDPERTGCHPGTSLTDAVVRVPTPKATDGTKGSPNQRGTKGDLTLPFAAKYPTPTTQDAENTGGPAQYGRNTIPLNAVVTRPIGAVARLNPRWVEWLMGWPIGWASLEPLPPRAFQRWVEGSTEWWVSDPSEQGGSHGEAEPVTRTIDGVLYRVDQLRALGNGQVPQAAREAWRAMA